MGRKEYFGVLTLLAVICSVVADGKLSFGTCPNVPVPNLGLRDVVGTWFVILETGGQDSCVSYEFLQLEDGTDGLIKKTSLGGRGEYDFDYGALVKSGDRFHFVWPGSFEFKSGSFIKYDENTMGLFTCESRSLFRKQTAYLLSKTGVVQEQALTSFVHSFIAFKLHADDFEEINQQSCPRVLITSLARESDIGAPVTSTTLSPTMPTRTTEPSYPSTTRQYTPPATERSTATKTTYPTKIWHYTPPATERSTATKTTYPTKIWHYTPTIAPPTVRQTTTITPTTARPTSRGMSFDESDWHSEHSKFDIPWLPAEPRLALDPLPEPDEPYTSIRPTTTTTTQKRTTPRTTEEWTTVGSVRVIPHPADGRSEEASSELEF